MCTQTTVSSPAPAKIAPAMIPLPALPTVQRTRTLIVEPNEGVRIIDTLGRALCTIIATDDGPIVQLAESGTALDVAGKLRIHADSIEMIARDGEMKLLSKDDVIVRGEKIRLN